MAIEVGYGLEGVLPDGLAGQVIRDDFTPRFRDNDYSGGIRNGVMRLADIVEKQQVLTPARARAVQRRAAAADVPIFIIIPFFGLFVGIGFGMLGVGLRSKTGFPVLFGSLFGGMPLAMSLAFLGRLSLMTLLPFAIAMLVMGFRAGAKPAWRKAFRDAGSGKGGSSSSGWTMGGGRRVPDPRRAPRRLRVAASAADRRAAAERRADGRCAGARVRRVRLCC